MKYIIYYDDKVEYYRVMEPKHEYRANEIAILKTDSPKIAMKVTGELNEKMLKHDFH